MAPEVPEPAIESMILRDCMIFIQYRKGGTETVGAFGRVSRIDSMSLSNCIMLMQSRKTV
jgi:hypothetical protein